MIGLSRGNRRALLKTMRKGFWMPVTQPAPITHILDVGAHVGMFAVYARMNWPNAEVVAVEPDPRNHSRLTHNVQNLDIGLLEGAFGSGWIGQANLFEHDTSSLQYRPTEDHGAKLYGMSLCDMLRSFQTPPDVLMLKIDIEGAEHALMDKPELGVDVLQRAHAIALEVHPPRERFADWFASTLQPTHTVTIVSRRRGGEPNVIHAVKKEWGI